MRPMGSEGDGWIAQRGRSLISTIALLTCAAVWGLNFYVSIYILCYNCCCQHFMKEAANTVGSNRTVGGGC